MRSKADQEIIDNQAKTIKIMRHIKISGGIGQGIIKKAKIDDNYVAHLEAEFIKFKKESTMIPFNLERALAGDKVINKDGDEVTQLKEFIIDKNPYVYGVINRTVTKLYYNDLFMAPKKLSGFINIYTDNTIGVIHRTRGSANYNCTRERSACIDLSQHDEGEGI